MISTLLAKLTGLIWNYPVVILCLGSAIYFTVFRLNFIQFRCFKHALDLIRGKYDEKGEVGEITHFQALSTALSGTVGLGNIAGVAIAISLGGPGSILWMNLVGLLAMATKYVECALGTLYRDIDPKTGKVKGGPMFYISKALGKRFKPLATFYAFATFGGAVGAGNMFQSNQAAAALESQFNIPPLITGIIICLIVGFVVIGGIKRIGKVAEKIVPFMCGIYVLGALAICFLNFHQIPSIIEIIIKDAFTGQAVAGGSIGTVIIWGVRRAIFSNEAGMGSAAIAHAAVKTNFPIREGIVASLEPFIDTVLVCSATAIVIVMSGFYGSAAGDLTGIALTIKAFDTFLPGFGSLFISIAVTFFAFSTMLSWSYYGEITTQFLFGKKYIVPFKLIFCGLIIFGAVNTLTDVLNFSDLSIGLMVIPNMIAILLLSKEVKTRTQSYFKKLKAGELKKAD